MPKLPKLDPLVELIIPTVIFLTTLFTTYFGLHWHGLASVLAAIGITIPALWGIFALEDWHRRQDDAAWEAFGRDLKAKANTMTPEEVADLKNTPLM